MKTVYAAVIGLAVWAMGCQEPGYRNEVTAGPQGQVEVHRVPKDAPPANGAPAMNDAARTVGPPASAASPTASQLVDDKTLTVDQRIAALQRQVKELQDQIEQLERQKQQQPR